MVLAVTSEVMEASSSGGRLKTVSRDKAKLKRKMLLMGSSRSDVRELLRNVQHRLRAEGDEKRKAMEQLYDVEEIMDIDGDISAQVELFASRRSADRAGPERGVRSHTQTSQSEQPVTVETAVASPELNRTLGNRG